MGRDRSDQRRSQSAIVEDLSSFYTIQSPTTGLFKEKGSKFLSFAFPVTSEEEIKECQDSLRKEYHDARHHCYAWVLGMDQQTWRSNDDGEPSHSAGDPILGQIRSFELTNILVVVVRYFGGTKLGVGGLISAYKTATEECLKSADRKEIFEHRIVTFTFEYDSLSVVERLVSDFDISVSERDFRESCKLSGAIKKELVDLFKSRIVDLYDVKIEINHELV